jgi:ribose 5-phosphate isomerase
MEGEPMELYLVRHGETEWSRARRHTGRTDVPLSPVGEAEARALGDHLRGLEVDRVLSSPMARAVATAKLTGFGDRVELSDALLEFDYGDFEGLTTSEIRAERPGWDLFRDGCPGGETVEAAAARVRPLLAELTAQAGRAILFSHGHQLRILSACYLGLPPEAARHLFLGTASLSVLGTEHEWPAVLLWNEQEGSGAHVAEAGTTGWRGVPGSARIGSDDRPEAAVEAARGRVEPGMTIGLGSGRAVFALIDLLAAGWPAARPLRAVVASSRTEARARAAGIELVTLDGDLTLDLAVDGADEVDHHLGLLKGGGGALLREKLVLAAARRVVIVAEAAKLVDRLGTTKALPVEVVRFAWPATRRRLLDLVPSATLRVAPDGAPAVTDEGHHLLDCAVPDGDLNTLATALKTTLGVVEHGLFLDHADEVLLGDLDGRVQVLRR